MNSLYITDTYQLIGVVDKIKPAASFLVERFFPNELPAAVTTWVSTEYRKAGRILAPYVVKGGRGINIGRDGSTIYHYQPPIMAPRRVIGINDIETRQFGETLIYSNVTAQDRAARMQAEDLTELLRMIQNRKNKMAAEILTAGKAIIKGYADDGRTYQQDEITFDWDGAKTVTKNWSDATAKIFTDIKNASEEIQENSGAVPTLMVIGKNVEQYLLSNEEIFNWLSIPSRENLNMMTFAPKYTSPQARFVGYLSALNLEIVSYLETYTDETGVTQPFLDADTVIIGVPDKGRQLYGAVNYMDAAGNWQTAAASYVPVYQADPNAQQSSVTIFSRCLLVPEDMGDWICLKVKK